MRGVYQYRRVSYNLMRYSAHTRHVAGLLHAAER